ncbi:hypothetical protein OC842_001268 [Tilletia horrida]|uniref:Carbohydrate kinase PfkB domain-containing protein n=1 Tax=Tilletia horrida TaxID=155126 RepID=A0AAN6JTD3_9BASI|nr:hypothetical protein OC842_001268 [Tilletia horrida]
MSGLSRFVRIHESVAAALASSRPCVALESTIITHGLPPPLNLKTALTCEDAIRKEGAVPATIALLDGVAHVGLDRAQLERLAEAATRAKKDKAAVIKASRRDLAPVLALGAGTIGGTTVSGTMVLAHHAGIPIFATGGIGGVHRGAETTMDISADLTELARTPVSVFCSGAKSILSLPQTLEYLETAGVTVASFHPQGRFPAFYAQDSGLTVTKVCDPLHAAEIIHASASLGLGNGIVFGVPIPDSHASAGEEIQKAVEQAVRESVAQGIDKRGKEVTPWLLARSPRKPQYATIIYEPAAGSIIPQLYSYRMNLDRSSVLVIGCAAVDISAQTSLSQQLAATTYPGTVRLSAGGVARNVAEASARLLRASQRQQSVPRSELSSPLVQLVAPLAMDPFGTFLIEGAHDAGVRTDGFFIVPAASADQDGRKEEEAAPVRTAVCSLTLDRSGDLCHGVADFQITDLFDRPMAKAQGDHGGGGHRDRFYRHLRMALEEAVNCRQNGVERPHAVVACDANLGPEVLYQVLDFASQDPPQARQRRQPTLLYEPTSLPKCAAILEALQRLRRDGPHPTAASAEPVIDIITPNALELLHLHAAATKMGLIDASHDDVGGSPLRPDEGLEEILAAAQDLSALFGWIFLKRGKDGVLVIRRAAPLAPPSSAPGQKPQNNNSTPLRISRHPSPVQLQAEEIISTTGAGDTFAGALIAAVSLKGPPSTWDQDLLDDVVAWAQRAAVLTVGTVDSVAHGLDDLPLQTPSRT